MAKQTNAKIGFENELWAAADAMRGNVSASDYRKIVVGLIFLKYVSDAFDFRYQELLNAEDYYEGDEEDRDAYIEKNVFFVPETARWSGEQVEHPRERLPERTDAEAVEHERGEPPASFARDQHLRARGAFRVRQHAMLF